MTIPAVWLTRGAVDAPDRAKRPERAYNPRVSQPEAPKSELADNLEVARGFMGAPVSAVLLAANIGVFAAQVYVAGGWRSALAMPDGVLRRLGANASLWTIADNRVETLVTACFLHGSVLHLLFNMLVLWQVGPLLERAIGSARFFPLYLVSGILGSAASAIWGRAFGQTVSVGASGALCGLIAAATVVGIRTEGWRSELAVGMGRWLGVIVLIGVVRSFYPNLTQIDNAAHIGGAAGGALVAVTWLRGFAYERRAAHAVIAACVGIVLATGAAVHVRSLTDPYLYMTVEERVRAAHVAVQAGRCEEARAAIERAARMDPKNRFIRARSDEIVLVCAEGPGRERSARPSEQRPPAR